MEFGDLPALLTAAGAIALGVLGFIVPTAKDRSERRASRAEDAPAVDQGRTVDFMDDLVDSLRESGDLKAEAARWRAVAEARGSEIKRLESSIRRRDEKIRERDQMISRLQDNSN